MSILEQVAPGALGPGFTSAAIFAAAWAVWRARRREGVLHVGALLAVAAGFAVGFLVILKWPALPLAPGTDAWYWVAWFAPAAVLVGFLEQHWRAPVVLRVLTRLAISTGAAWLILEPNAGMTSGRWWGALGLAAAGMTLLWTVVGAKRPNEAPERTILPSMIATGATATVLAFVSGSLSMGQVTGALSAALAAPLALAVVLRLRGVTSAAAPVVALVFGGLLLSAYAYLNYADVVNFPATTALLLLGGAVLGSVLSRRLRSDASRLLVFVVAALPPVVLSGIAAWVAHANLPPPNPYA